MFKHLWKRLQDKPWLKILVAILFAFCGIGVVLGIIFSALNVSRVNQSKEGMSLGGAVETEIHLQTNPTASASANLAAISDDATAFVHQLDIAHVSQIDAQYGLAGDNGNGVVEIYTPQSNALFNYDPTLTGSAAATQAFGIFLRFNHSYNLQLVNANSILPKGSTATMNFTGGVDAINAGHKMVLRNGSLTIPLAKTWDFNNFQIQFNKVFPGWNGKLTYQQLVAKNPHNMTKAGNAPEKLLVLWNNRAGLIQELRLVTLVSYLNENLASLGGDGATNVATQTAQITGIYGMLSAPEKSFGTWALSEIQTVLNDLNAAQAWNLADTGVDPLLSLLGEYYSSGVYEQSLKNPAKTNPWIGNPGQYLYSWNLQNLSLINPFLRTIDYANFYNYFTYNLKKLTRSSFSTKNFVLSEPSTVTKYKLGSMVQLYNKGVIRGNFVIPGYAAFNAAATTNVQGCANILSNFLATIKPVTNSVSASVTKLNAYAGAMVGISVFLLLVGIIVSVLYRFPGVMAFLFSGLVFLITATIYPNVGLTFYFNTFIGLMITSLVPFLLIMRWMEAIRQGIRQGLNLTNATVAGFRVYIRNVLAVYLAVLIAGIVFLFFGQGQLQGFGTVLVVGDLLTILFFVFIYITLYFTAQWLFMGQHPSWLLGRKYTKLLVEINQVKFGSVNFEQTGWVDRVVSPQRIRYIWLLFLPLSLFVVMGIIGMIVLGVLGPGFSIYFGSTSMLTFTFPSAHNPLTPAVISSLANHMHTTWFKVVVGAPVAAITGSTQTIILESGHRLAPSMVYAAINAVNASLLNDLVLKFGNHFMPNLLKLNLIAVVGISLAFLAFLSFILLNFVNILPIAFVLVVAAICVTGITGFFRIPVDPNTMISYGQIWVVIVTLVFFQFTNYKLDYKMKQRYDRAAMVRYMVKHFGHVVRIVSIWSALYLMSALVMMLFSSTSFVFQILELVLAIVFIYMITVPMIPFLFFGVMSLREWYLGRLFAARGNRAGQKNYDKVDEQEIFGLNKH